MHGKDSKTSLSHELEVFEVMFPPIKRTMRCNDQWVFVINFIRKPQITKHLLVRLSIYGIVKNILKANNVFRGIGHFSTIRIMPKDVKIKKE